MTSRSRVRGVRFVVSAVLVALLMSANQNVSVPRADASGANMVLPQAAGVVGPYEAVSFPDAFPIHGVGGDTRILFVVQPSPGPSRAPGVHVASRLGGALLGSFPPPPVAWKVPLSIIVEQSTEAAGGTDGRVLVLDAGGPPTQFGLVTTFVHRYRYSFRPPNGFTAVWEKTSALPVSPPLPLGTVPSGIVYTDGFARLGDGTVAVNDTILGAIWTSDSSLDHWRLAVLDPDFAAGLGYEAHGHGRAPGGGTRPYTFRTPGDLYPGIHSMAYADRTDELCAVRTAPPGGIWCMARSVLVNGLLPPVGKPKRVVVAPQVGLSDATDGLAYDSFHPQSAWLYWARAFSDEIGGGSNILRRVNLLTGRMEEVARSLTVYDFTSNLAALPPIGGADRTVIFSAVGQEENNPEVNKAPGVLPYVAPSPLPLVEVPYS